MMAFIQETYQVVDQEAKLFEVLLMLSSLQGQPNFGAFVEPVEFLEEGEQIVGELYVLLLVQDYAGFEELQQVLFRQKPLIYQPEQDLLALHIAGLEEIFHDIVLEFIG